jgi:hypothetical protein
MTCARVEEQTHEIITPMKNLQEKKTWWNTLFPESRIVNYFKFKA